MMGSGKYLRATSRAARIIAGAASSTAPQDFYKPLREAEHDGTVTELVMALAALAADLARQLHGDEHVQAALDGLAFDAITYERKHVGGL